MQPEEKEQTRGGELKLDYESPLKNEALLERRVPRAISLLFKRRSQKADEIRQIEYFAIAFVDKSSL